MRLAVLGLGKVGLNLLSILDEYRDYHFRNTGERIVLAAVADFRHTLYSEEGMDQKRVTYYKSKGDVWGTGYQEIMREELLEKDIDVLVDVTTASKTGDYGRDLYLKAFRNGIDVVTAKKSPLANHWKVIMQERDNHRRKIRYESTVSGGVPLFSFTDYSLLASPVRLFRGIVNSTANLLLHEASKGTPMDKAIEDAQKKGIAEADPSLDVDGYDNAWKALIVSNTISSVPKQISDISFQGVREYISESGKVKSNARLVSEVRILNGEPEITASVIELNAGDPLLAMPEDSLGYYVETDTGRFSVTGYHDGPRETAAGVMNDIVLVTREREKSPRA